MKSPKNSSDLPADNLSENTFIYICIPNVFGFDCYRDFISKYIHNDKPYSRYILDFKSADRINICSLGILLKIKELVGNATEILLVNCNQEVALALNAYKLDRCFNISIKSY
jgi:anti-anti-sigma regulatory factor